MIKAGDSIRIHYELRLADADLIESTFGGDPETLVVGRGEFPSFIETRILDMAPGEEREIDIPAGVAAFGARNPAAVQSLDVALFEPGQTTPGLLVEFETPGGDWVRGRVESVDAARVVVDFNNPLIGRNVHCRIRLVDIVATESES